MQSIKKLLHSALLIGFFISSAYPAAQYNLPVVEDEVDALAQDFGALGDGWGEEGVADEEPVDWEHAWDNVVEDEDGELVVGDEKDYASALQQWTGRLEDYPHIKEALEKNPDINQEIDEEGNTFLHDAVKRNDNASVYFLVHNGASICKKNKSKESACSLARSNKEIKVFFEKCNDFLVAAGDGRLDLVAKALEVSEYQCPAPINIQIFDTPLIVAARRCYCSNDHVDVVRYLLSFLHVNPNSARPDNGNTALHEVVISEPADDFSLDSRKFRLDVLQLLLNHPKTNLDVVNKERKTALQIAQAALNNGPRGAYTQEFFYNKMVFLIKNMQKKRASE